MKAITLPYESYHFSLWKLCFYDTKRYVTAHKTSQNVPFLPLSSFFKKRPPWKSRFTATLSHFTPPMGSCSTTAEKCAQNEFSVFRTFRTFSLSQMTKAKLVWALAWREKVHEYEQLISPIIRIIAIADYQRTVNPYNRWNTLFVLFDTPLSCL